MDSLKILKPAELDVSDEAPYQNDLLGREELGQNLTTLIKSCDQPTVIALDGRWGCGKTTFIQMWQKELDNKHLPSVMFNSWACDWADDPLIPIAVNMSDVLSKRIPRCKKALGLMLETAVAAKDAIAPRIVDAVLKGLSAGVVDREVTKAIAESIEDKIATPKDVTGGHVTDQVEEYRSRQNAIDSFRESLIALKKIIDERPPTKEGAANPEGPPKDWPLVIIMDELDRCRPTWAIETLERMKHMFDVPGVVFVLAVDFEQLAESVKAVYGSGFDGRKYLRRFVDLRISMEPAAHKTAESVQSLCRQHSINSQPTEIIAQVAIKYSLSIRDLHQIISRVHIYREMLWKAQIRANQLGNEAQSVAAILVLLSEIAPELYHKVKEGDAKTEDILSWLSPVQSQQAHYPYRKNSAQQYPAINIAASWLGDDSYAERFISGKPIEKEEYERIQIDLAPINSSGREHLFSIMNFVMSIDI